MASLANLHIEIKHGAKLENDLKIKMLLFLLVIEGMKL
jgi:hypothetical protein